MRARNDNFGALRLAAATAVIASHAFLLTGRVDPFQSLAGETLGDTAVAVFFAISGFLVAGSWSRDPHLARFLARRAKRILPGMAGAVLFTAYVVGPLFTRLPLKAYLDGGDPQRYVISELAMLRGGGLAGVFTSNPLSEANGSLWTLPVEVKAYLCLAALALAGGVGRRWVLWGAWLIAVEAAVLVRAFDIVPTTTVNPRSAYLFAVFLGSVLVFRERERLPLRGGVAGALLLAWIAARGTTVQAAIGALAFPYSCVWLAYRTRPVLTRFVERTDLSYGLYLYSYPVEQAVRGLGGPSVVPVAVVAIALPVSVVLAYCSWAAIEQPWLRTKGKGRLASSLGDHPDAGLHGVPPPSGASRLPAGEALVGG